MKKLGRIGGDDGKVRARLAQILSKINQKIKFRIVDVRVRGVGSRPPIYEVTLEDSESASALRRGFSKFTQKRNPVSCPPELSGVEVTNSATIGTRVRISILRVTKFISFPSIFLFGTVFS